MPTQLSGSSDMLVTLTSDIVIAHVSNNTIAGEDLPALIANVYAALAAAGAAATEEPPLTPAVSIRSSVKKDHLVCLEDGRKLKTLKRHLKVEHDMTPDEYRKRWGLGSGYPMVAADYTETRRSLAKKIGLGRKPGTKVTRAAAPKALPAAAPAAGKAPARKAPPKKTAVVKGTARAKKGGTARGRSTSPATGGTAAG